MNQHEKIKGADFTSLILKYQQNQINDPIINHILVERVDLTEINGKISLSLSDPHDKITAHFIEIMATNDKTTAHEIKCALMPSAGKIEHIVDLI